MKVSITPQERTRAIALAERRYRTLPECEELIALDVGNEPSILADEAVELCEITERMHPVVHAGKMRFSSYLRIAELVLDIQIEIIAERKQQLQEDGSEPYASQE